MSERIGKSFPGVVAAITLCGVLVIAGALLLISRGQVIDGALLGGAVALLLRWYWRTTGRQRALLRHGFYTGRRIGTNWVYEELHEGIVVSLELPLEYAGRGEYDIHIPSERDWQVGMPAWAHGRRAEIVERLQTVFKRSQMHFDADKSLEPG
jgi:hypothetical protein